MGTERFAYIAQLCFMHELDDLEGTSDFMLELRSRLGGFLALLRQAELDIAGPDGARVDILNAEDFHVHLAVRMGVRSLEAKVRWCDEALEQIEQRRQPRAAAAGGAAGGPERAAPYLHKITTALDAVHAVLNVISVHLLDHISNDAVIPPRARGISLLHAAACRGRAVHRLVHRS